MGEESVVVIGRHIIETLDLPCKHTSAQRRMSHHQNLQLAAGLSDTIFKDVRCPQANLRLNHIDFGYYYRAPDGIGTGFAQLDATNFAFPHKLRE